MLVRSGGDGKAGGSYPPRLPGGPDGDLSFLLRALVGDPGRLRADPASASPGRIGRVSRFRAFAGVQTCASKVEGTLAERGRKVAAHPANADRLSNKHERRSRTRNAVQRRIYAAFWKNCR